MAVDERIRDIVTDALADSDLELISVRLTGSKHDRAVDVIIDRIGGVDLATCTGASRAISAALDSTDPLEGSFCLDVGSPGAERVLETPRDFRLATGRLVSIISHDGQTVEGKLLSTHATVAVVGTSDGGIEIDIEDIDDAKTVLDWGNNKQQKVPATDEQGIRP